MATGNIFRASSATEDDHWISVSDLMAGLMIIFLFIAITYIRPILNERDAIKEIAVAWHEAELELYEKLEAEFADDLPRWNAELDKETLSVRFKAPDVLFDAAQATLKPEFEEILRDFFPRYIAVLTAFEKHISEVRIEGHTSSEWEGVDEEEAYFRNMGLSQARTRSVLRFCLELLEPYKDRQWARGVITANGLSSSKAINVDGVEDRERSRRVEFTVRTNAKQQIVKILETVG
jgi:outer membrane protein OmpA-like peptidoglycan-associated protein